YFVQLRIAKVKQTTTNGIDSTLELSIKVTDDGMADIGFGTFGCASAIATTSMLTEIVKGKTLKEAGSSGTMWYRTWTAFPPVKVHCSPARR
ncbi:MAG: iron-sulfur cluster assembly scaffold protein, partial [Desulfobacterales bacterium]|nr:iron-sulfur cluster assembly scaffold protein [Desulfobacterales bacterium]